jgi:hypothetical protein
MRGGRQIFEKTVTGETIRLVGEGGEGAGGRVLGQKSKRHINQREGKKKTERTHEKKI